MASPGTRALSTPPRTGLAGSRRTTPLSAVGATESVGTAGTPPTAVVSDTAAGWLDAGTVVVSCFAGRSLGTTSQPMTVSARRRAAERGGRCWVMSLIYKEGSEPWVGARQRPIAAV